MASVARAARRSLAPTARGDGLRVLFFGSDDFALPSLQELHRRSAAGGAVAALEVVCPARSNFRRKSGPLPVAAWADAARLPVHAVGPEHRGSLAAWAPPPRARDGARFDLAVVVSFGHFLPAVLLRRFPLGAVNLHPSLLPRWRGASPVQHTVLRGDAAAGVSVIDVHPTRMDAGDVLAQEPLGGFDGGALDGGADGDGGAVTHAALRAALAGLGAGCVGRVAGRGRAAFARARRGAVPQAALLPPAAAAAAGGGGTGADDQPRAPKITDAMRRVAFCAEGARAVDRRWRAFGDGGSGCWATLDGRRVRLVALAAVDGGEGGAAGGVDAAPGSWQLDRRRKAIVVQCEDGGRVAVTALAMEGKKTITAPDFKNAYFSTLGGKYFA